MDADTIRSRLADALHQAGRLRDAAEAPAQLVGDMAAWRKLKAGLRELPPYLLAARVLALDVDGWVDPAERAVELVDRHVEFAALSCYTGKIRVSVFNGIKTSKGDLVLGKARKLGGRDRWLAEDTIWWDVEFSLIAWLLLDAWGRDRLVHHELGHLKLDDDFQPKIKGHDIEEHIQTLARFGPQGLHQEAAVAAGAAHPDAYLTPDAREVWKARAEERGLLPLLPFERGRYS